MLIGSGVTVDNVRDLFSHADGFIVGSALKEGGVWDAPVSEARVQEIVGVLERARAAHGGRLMKN